MAYSEAQNRATQKYQKKAYDRMSLVFPKGFVDDKLKPAAERAGVTASRYVIEAVEARIANESSLARAAETAAKAFIVPYSVTFRIRSDSPSDGTGTFSAPQKKVVEASSEHNARIAFFDWLIEQMPGWEIVSRDAETLVMGDDDGSQEVCEIVNVE